MGMAAEIPECLSMIICDDVYRDERTRKTVLVGAFSTICAASFPCAHPKMVAFFTLTNGRGEYDLSLKVEHEQTGATLLEMKGPLRLSNPLDICDFHVEILGLRFPEPGKYWIFLAVNGEIIKQRPFLVQKVGHEG
jgi:hypothetical protein